MATRRGVPGRKMAGILVALLFEEEEGAEACPALAPSWLVSDGEETNK